MTGPRPDFLGIGAQRSGTTWLSEMLTRHPHLQFPQINGHMVKEVHFWDRPGQRTLDWWLSLFDKPGPRIMAGEYTPAYGPLELETVRTIGAINPALRLIYLMRNPVDRAWSGALHHARDQKLDPATLSDSWFISHFGSRHSLGRGDYEACLKTWSQVFPRRQFLLATYDSVQQRPRELLARCCRFLGVDEAPMAELPDEVVAVRVNRSPRLRLRPVLVEALLEIYAPRIDSLSRYLGQDLGHWRTTWERRLAALPAQPKI